MTTFDHTRWSEDLAAYLLGALDPEEATTFERHLEGCDRCREEMRWLGAAVGTLPEAVERQKPPRQLRERLMAEVRAEARRERQGEGRSWLSELTRGRGLRLATGFAVLALLVAGAAGYLVGDDGSETGGGESTIVRRIDGVTVKMIQQGDRGTLQLSDLHQPPSGKVLEAWVLREGEVESVQPLFVPDRHGRAEAAIADMSGVEEVMVTEEPRGGSEAPTGKPVFAMAVPQ